MAVLKLVLVALSLVLCISSITNGNANSAAADAADAAFECSDDEGCELNGHCDGGTT